MRFAAAYRAFKVSTGPGDGHGPAGLAAYEFSLVIDEKAAFRGAGPNPSLGQLEIVIAYSLVDAGAQDPGAKINAHRGYVLADLVARVWIYA
jgi:hypothetical protein